MVFLLLLLLQDVLVGRDSLTPPLQIAHFPSQRIVGQMKNLLPNVGIH